MIKTYTIIIFLLFTISVCCSQRIDHDDRRFISVTGSAEVVIQPDEIELQIVLKEYDLALNKEKIEKIESDFFKILKQNSISSEQVLLNDSQYSWYRWWSYRNDFHGQKHYILKLSTETDLMSFMKELNIKGVHSINISKTTSSKSQALRKEIKISAMKAAKEKAEYLLESVGEKVGQLISVQEIINPYSRYSNSPIRSNSSRSIETQNQIENISPILIRYEVKTKFAIKE